MEINSNKTDNLPHLVNKDGVIRWLEEVASRTDSVATCATGLIDDIYDIEGMTEDGLVRLYRHLKTGGHYAEKFGVIVIMDGRAAGWSPNAC